MDPQNQPATPTPAPQPAAPAPAPQTAPASGIVLAGQLARLGAIIVDAILLIVVLVPVGMAFGGLRYSATTRPNMVAALISVGITFLYFFLLENSSWQATVGKKLLSLKVVDMSGAKATTAQVLKREGSRSLLSLIGQVVSGPGNLLGLIDVLFIASKQRQTLHDRVGQTLVVSSK